MHRLACNQHSVSPSPCLTRTVCCTIRRSTVIWHCRYHTLFPTSDWPHTIIVLVCWQQRSGAGREGNKAVCARSGPTIALNHSAASHVTLCRYIAVTSSNSSVILLKMASSSLFIFALLVVIVHSVHPTEIRASISPSSAVELNTTSALANYATEAALEKFYESVAYTMEGVHSNEDNVRRSQVIPCERGEGRKRHRKPEKWKRALEKAKRYSAKSLPRLPQCKHVGKSLKCCELSMQDIRKFHQSFYSEKDKQVQDNFILKYTHSESPKRRRPRAERKQVRETINRFLVPKTTNGKTELVNVCKKGFCSILGINLKRAQRVCNRHFKTGLLPSENRGGDHKSHHFVDKKAAVKSYIESLVPLEKHYCRASSKTKQYLPSYLSISRLSEKYNENVPTELKVPYSYFYEIFTNDYNLSFGSPAVDKCSKCIQYELKIQAGDTSCVAEQELHKRRSDAFFSQLRAKNDGQLVSKQTMKKPGQWHFKFASSKRFIITRGSTPTAPILIKGEPWYNIDIGMSRKVFKPKVDVSQLTLPLIPIGVPVKRQKIVDVKRLLDLHFGEGWEENPNLHFYQDIIFHRETTDEASEDELEGGMMEDADDI
uniref:Uncharacterized protein n=1 Tax=Timema tahoe TaxID=61484 RepID=A0A7R9ILC4_9NEOP|nr:unnamed protein product [Timema tahoe]